MSTAEVNAVRDRIRFVVKSRGIVNSFERAGQVASRFGLTAARMEARLRRYADVVAEAGFRPSLPITARVLARNPRVAVGLQARGVELCVHGLIHNDLTRLPEAAQAGQIEEACEVFRHHCISFVGFRSPYLKHNAATLAAVEKAGFEYDSNLPFYWRPTQSLGDLSPREQDGLERGLRFYDPRSYPEERSLPRFVGGLVEIPVSLPDDEMLLDRMSLSSGRVGKVWVEMIQTALARGELLTLQLHPERLSILEGPLRDVLRIARTGGGAWLATLGEVAAWWKARTAVSLAVQTVGPGTHRVGADGGLRAGVSLVRPATGAVTAVQVPGTITCPRRPLVGVAPGAPASLRRRIRELGYFIDNSDTIDDPRDCAIRIESSAAAEDVGRLLDACDRPLLREGIWPLPYRAALAVTGDIDCLTLGDFLRRFWRG
jgi:peptidoglycan/xylan/chitin deacetylase (PgdA/CDA1 family)